MRSVALLLLVCAAAFQAAGAATITVENKCSYTIWAAASPGGGQQLGSGQTWSFGVAAGTIQARVWGRTGCNFDASGHGSCQTGDCNGQLQCSGYGTLPATLAEYALNQYQNLDFYDISLVDGFNVPLSMYPSGSGCKAINCNKDINSICPSELRVTGACASACTKFHDDKYCCTGSAANNCGPTNYSEIFKNQCPQAYSYPKDDSTSTFTCPAGGDYRVVFCG